jgi:hypothetical protein
MSFRRRITRRTEAEEKKQGEKIMRKEKENGKEKKVK